MGVCCRTQRANDAWVKDLVHDNRVACSGMTLEHSRFGEVEPKISHDCPLRLATLSCPHVHTFRPLSCRVSCFVLSCAPHCEPLISCGAMVPRENANSEQPVQTSIRSLQGGSGDVYMDSFFEHVRKRSRDNISGVQDRTAHPLLSNSPRWSTTCVVDSC